MRHGGNHSFGSNRNLCLDGLALLLARVPSSFSSLNFLFGRINDEFKNFLFRYINLSLGNAEFLGKKRSCYPEVAAHVRIINAAPHPNEHMVDIGAIVEEQE